MIESLPLLIFAPDSGKGGLSFFLKARNQFAVGCDECLLFTNQRLFTFGLCFQDYKWKAFVIKQKEIYKSLR